jgi:MoaA/NifB/PqqE/SkfB family radical SAM enzyme
MNLPHYPLRGLQFETNTVCNARCSFCEYSCMEKRQPAKWSTLLDILYWYGHKTLWCCPFGMQEPLFEPRLTSILAAIRQFNPYTGITIYSNMSIHPEDTWRRIVHYQLLDRLCVSFYGTDKATYNKLQPPLDFEETQRNIKALVKLKRSLGWKNPTVEMHLLVTKDTSKNLNHFIKKWTPIVDKVGLVHYDSWMGKRKDWDNEEEEKFWKNITPQLTERVPCHRLWTEASFRCNGELVPCCSDCHIEEPCGKIESDPYIWWNSKRLNEIRNLHLQGQWSEIPICRNCSVWRRETPPEWITHWQKLLAVAPIAAPPSP